MKPEDRINDRVRIPTTGRITEWSIYVTPWPVDRTFTLRLNGMAQARIRVPGEASGQFVLTPERPFTLTEKDTLDVTVDEGILDIDCTIMTVNLEETPNPSTNVPL